ncbi:MAG: PAS domain-containing protein [Kofleriaceae bacterium]
MATPLDVMFPGDSELANLMRAKDWASTPLGPVEHWPAKLRAAVGIVLTSRFAMWMGWGEQLAFLYNDAYRTDTLGPKHPRSLGMAASEVWSEIWPEIAPRVRDVVENGKATFDEGLMLMLERFGYREETYHTFSYSPLHDDDGAVRGLLCVVVEETARLISERRVALLGRVASEITGTRTEVGVLEGLARALTGNARDLPFTLTYLFDDAGITAQLVASTGFEGSSARIPESITLGASAPWLLQQVLEGERPLEVPLDGADWPCGPWGTPPRSAFVLPLASQGQARPAGVLITGINPHRPFDTTYVEFLSLFAGQLAGGLANARAYALERHSCREPRRARPREEHILLERQPRVPHATHTHARPARRGDRRSCAGAVDGRRARHGPAQCAALAQARQHDARFLADRSGTRRRAVPAGRPRGADDRSRERIPGCDAEGWLAVRR